MRLRTRPPLLTYLPSYETYLIPIRYGMCEERSRHLSPRMSKNGQKWVFCPPFSSLNLERKPQTRINFVEAELDTCKRIRWCAAGPLVSIWALRDPLEG